MWVCVCRGGELLEPTYYIHCSNVQHIIIFANINLQAYHIVSTGPISNRFVAVAMCQWVICQSAQPPTPDLWLHQ